MFMTTHHIKLLLKDVFLYLEGPEDIHDTLTREVYIGIIFIHVITINIQSVKYNNNL